MLNIKIIVPFLVLFVKIVLKLLVGRKVDKRVMVDFICEFPTDIIFLSFSFSFLYFTLEIATNKDFALIPIIVIVVLSVVVVYLFRESKDLSDNMFSNWKKMASFILLIIINYTISLVCLSYTMNHIVSKTQEHIQSNKTEIEIKKCN